MPKVVKFDGITTLDIPADRILESNIGNFSKCIIIGYDHEDTLSYALSIADVAEVNLLVDRFKLELLNSLYDEEE